MTFLINLEQLLIIPMPRNFSLHPRIISSSPTHSERHYNAALSIWLSVDPMSDKYPGVSPYAYCGNNPVRLVDPNGTTVVIPDEEDRKFINQLIDTKSENYSKSFHSIYKKLDEQKDHIYTFESWNYDANRTGFEEGKYENKGDGTSTINFSKGDSPMVRDETMGASQFRNLFEETYHAYQDRHGKLQNSCIAEAAAWKFSASAPGTIDKYLDQQSNRVVTSFMGRLQKLSISEIAMGFKFGFPPTTTTVGVSNGPYRDFQIGTKQEMNLYFPNWPNY